MNYLKSLLTQLIVTGLALQTPGLYAQESSSQRSQYPPLANIVYHSKNMRDFLEKIKTGITEAEYQFMRTKIADLPEIEMPKMREPKPSIYEISLRGTVTTLDATRIHSGIVIVNGRQIDLRSKSLEERFQLIKAVIINEKVAFKGLWNLFFPEAQAVEPATVIGIISLLLVFCGMLWENSKANCKDLGAAGAGCIELRSKLQFKATEIANFLNSQQTIVKEAGKLSEDVAKQIAENCKELNQRVPEIDVADFRGDAALEGATVRCDLPIKRLQACQKDLRKQKDQYILFLTQRCTAATTTSSAVVTQALQKAKDSKDKKETAETAIANDIPVLADPKAPTKVITPPEKLETSDPGAAAK